MVESESVSVTLVIGVVVLFTKVIVRVEKPLGLTTSG